MSANLLMPHGFRPYQPPLTYICHMNPIPSLVQIYRVIALKPKPKHRQYGLDDLLISHGFRSLSNSSEILAICTHIPSWVEIHCDLFESLRRSQIDTHQMPRHHSSKVSGLQPVELIPFLGSFSQLNIYKLEIQTFS